MTLSVCCMTADPVERVTRILELLRPVADEVVVAVDSRVDGRQLGPLAGVADQLFRFDFVPPVDRPRAWLASRCKGDHLFWIDGDEVPSPALVAALPTLAAAPDVVQCAFARRWLVGDPDHWLDETPWWPDFQHRLIRNDPTSAWFGSTHQPFGFALPLRYVDAPLYHLSCIVSSMSERRAKAERYEAERPGLVSPAGGPFNEVLLLPERYATRRYEVVPDSDQPWIASVLAAVPSPGGSHEDEVEVAPGAEIEALSPTRAFRSEAYRARLDVLERDLRFEPGLTRPLLVRVHNDGVETWPWGWHQPIQVHVSYHWYAADGTALVHDGVRTPMPHAVRPGDKLLVPVDVEAPVEPGRYVLELDLVHEGVTWFACGTNVSVLVAPRWRRHDPALR